MVPVNYVRLAVIIVLIQLGVPDAQMDIILKVISVIHVNINVNLVVIHPISVHNAMMDIIWMCTL